MSETVHLIVNPVSGRGRVRRLVEGLTRRIEGAGWHSLVRETRAVGDACAFADEAAVAGVRAVIACGGDGTVSEVMRGLKGRETPVLVVPGGTENILAKVLGTRARADWLWDVLREGLLARLDLLEMNERRFLLVAGVGFDAEVARRVSEGRRGPISYWSYVRPIARTLLAFSHPGLRVEVDGDVIHEGPALAFVGNVARYALGLRILHRASPSDGRLDVCVFQCRRRPTVLAHAARVLARGWLGRGGSVYRQGTTARITSTAPTGIELDGDYAGTIPASFRVIPAAVRFLVSREYEDAIRRDAHGGGNREEGAGNGA